MPYKPKHPCAAHPCSELTHEMYCEKHRKEMAKQYNHYQRDPMSAKRYSGSWKQIRARFLQAHPLCELCKQEGRLVPATIVHHKNPLKTSNDNSPENLQSLCQHHHSQLHMTELNSKP